MNKSQETRRKNEQARRERHERERAEVKAQVLALRRVRDDTDATPSERLEAVKMLEDMKKQCVAAMENLHKATADEAGQVLERAIIQEQKIDDMRDKFFKKQMQRLKKGKCKPQSGIVFSEVLTDFERMGDHALNIAQQYKEMN